MTRSQVTCSNGGVEENEIEVRFIKTFPSVWNGNGFGTSTAEWVAFVGDVEVGHYRADGRNVDLFGSPWFHGVTRWKNDIKRYASRYL